MTAHTILRNPFIALFQARLAQKGLKALECTSDGSFTASELAVAFFTLISLLLLRFKLLVITTFLFFFFCILILFICFHID